jgi:6-phosphogluconolactonase
MLKSWDERRNLALPGDLSQTIAFAVDHWIKLARHAIASSGRFIVALSGGSTPKLIFEKLAEHPEALDWSRVFLFWSDERAVPPDHPDSNYHMAMAAGFSHLPLLKNQIFRMKAESNIEENALEYEEKIRQIAGPELFDLVMLGLGDDGHTASLFPKTTALAVQNRLVVANHVPQKNTWRMTFTFSCINQSKHPVMYVLGSSKQEIVANVLKASLPSPWPASLIGTHFQKALWVLDNSSSKVLLFQ